MRRSIPLPFLLTVFSLSTVTACASKLAMEPPEAEVSQKSTPRYDFDDAVEEDEEIAIADAAEAGPAEQPQLQQLGYLAASPEPTSAAPADEVMVTEAISTRTPRAPRAKEEAKRKSRTSAPGVLGGAVSSGSSTSASTGISANEGGGAVATHVMPPPPPQEPLMDAPLPTTPYAGEGYADYGINPFVATSEDHLSTFAVDVDTASYTNTRRKLREGYLPPEQAVRVEEFVNYFSYDYRPPADGSPFSVHFEAAPSPWHSGYHILEVGVQGKKVKATERKPVHLTFLVDTSGSMRSDDKLGLVKQSLIMLTNELEDGDTVAIATYAGSTRVVLPPTPVSQNGRIVASLERLMAGGSTAMSSGIDNAYNLASQTYRPGHVNRVIVCSDGDANVGPTSHSVISQQIKGFAKKGITLTTLGFGNGNYQDTMMERLANDGDGNYFYIDSRKEAKRVLVDELTSTMEVIAKDVKIQVDFDSEQVLAYRLVGYENRDIADRDFRNDAVDAGEIGAGHQVTALYEVQLADDAAEGWATVRVRNKAPGPDSPAVERSFGLSSRDQKKGVAQTSDSFRIALASATFADVLRGGADWEGVSLQQVMDLARSAQRAEYESDAELIELIGIAARLRGEGALVMR